MKHVKSNAAAARPQLFYRIGSADTQYDILNSDDTLNHGDCKPSHATNTNVYVCWYTVDPAVNGAFRVKVGTASADKATNALASVYNHAATLTLDNTKPAIAFPASPAKPQVGVASTITLTDAGAKIAKYAVLEVPGTASDATGCDDPRASGDNFSTTAVSPAASPKTVSYTPPANSAGKKVCAYAEDAAGNWRSALWSAAIQAAPAGPTVSGIAITSTVPANQGGYYKIGDVIQVTATFNEAIAGHRVADAEDQGRHGGEVVDLREEGHDRRRREEARVQLHGGGGRRGHRRHRGRGGQARGHDQGLQRQRRDADLHRHPGQREPQGGRGPADDRRGSRW